MTLAREQDSDLVAFCQTIDANPSMGPAFRGNAFHCAKFLASAAADIGAIEGGCGQPLPILAHAAAALDTSAEWLNTMERLSVTETERKFVEHLRRMLLDASKSVEALNAKHSDTHSAN